MGSLFGGSTPKPPPPPPPAPTPEVPAVQAARAQAFAEGRRRKGRSATILAGNQDTGGLGGVSAGPSTTLGGDRR